MMLKVSRRRKRCEIVLQEIKRENGLPSDCIVAGAAPRAHLEL